MARPSEQLSALAHASTPAGMMTQPARGKSARRSGSVMTVIVAAMIASIVNTFWGIKSGIELSGTEAILRGERRNRLFLIG